MLDRSRRHPAQVTRRRGDTVVGTVHETKRGAAVAFASAPAVVQAADLWKLIANSSRW
jgi:hypothetical protein